MTVASKEMASHCTALYSVAKLKLRTSFFELVTYSGAGEITKEFSLKPAFMEAFNSAAINNQELATIVLIHGHIEADLREQPKQFKARHMTDKSEKIDEIAMIVLIHRATGSSRTPLLWRRKTPAPFCGERTPPSLSSMVKKRPVYRATIVKESEYTVLDWEKLPPDHMLHYTALFEEPEHNVLEQETARIAPVHGATGLVYAEQGTRQLRNRENDKRENLQKNKLFKIKCEQFNIDK